MGGRLAIADLMNTRLAERTALLLQVSLALDLPLLTPKHHRKTGVTNGKYVMPVILMTLTRVGARDRVHNA